MAKITTRTPEPLPPPPAPERIHTLTCNDKELALLARALYCDKRGPKIPGDEKYGGQDENTALFALVDDTCAECGFTFSTE